MSYSFKVVQSKRHLKLCSVLNYSTFIKTYHHKLEASSNTECLQSNPYAGILYNTVWALAIAMNRSVNYSRTTIKEELKHVTFQGVSDLLNYSKMVLH